MQRRSRTVQIQTNKQTAASDSALLTSGAHLNFNHLIYPKRAEALGVKRCAQGHTAEQGQPVWPQACAQVSTSPPALLPLSVAACRLPPSSPGSANFSKSKHTGPTVCHTSKLKWNEIHTSHSPAIPGTECSRLSQSWRIGSQPLQVDDSKLSIKSNPPTHHPNFRVGGKSFFSPQEFNSSEGAHASSSCSGSVVSKAILSGCPLWGLVAWAVAGQPLAGVCGCVVVSIFHCPQPPEHLQLWSLLVTCHRFQPVYKLL